MNKYEKWYQQIIANGKHQKLPGHERHHILPKSLDGTNDASNLVYITAREHFICHWLLTKIYPTGEEHWKMLNALRMMRAKNKNHQRYDTKITSRVYEKLKKEYALLQSEKVSGENNPMYGDKFHRSVEGTERQREAVSGEKNGAKKEKARKKISESKLGKKRDPFSDEWKAKMSESASGENNSRYGVTLTDKTKEKISNKLKGRKQTQEEKNRRGLANIGKTREKKLCPHCNQMIAVNGYARFHGDKCKKNSK
jgi:hypothetical protein